MSVELVGGGGFLHYLDREPEVALPEELVLQGLFDLDAHDPEALAHFTRNHGLLTTMVRTHDLRPDPLAFLPSGETYREPFTTLREATEVIAAGMDVLPDYIVPAEALGMHVRALRAMVRQWAAQVADEGEDAILAAWTSEGFTEPRSPWDAWRRWEDHLNSALRPYQVHVRADPDAAESVQPRGVVQTNAYSGMAAQLANFIAEGAAWRRCANTPCGRMFVRQHGRARHGQHRTTGVLYCSPSCAQAQKSREYRRRQRKGKR